LASRRVRHRDEGLRWQRRRHDGDYPREKFALFTVIAVQDPCIEVSDADGTHYRVTCHPRQAEPLRPGDVTIVDQATPAEGITVVERLTTRGQRDGCRYDLLHWQLASKAEPA
jgi:hypothetical protein